MARHPPSLRGLVAEIRDSKAQCSMFGRSSVFETDPLTSAQQARCQEHFDMWWRSWVDPKLERIALKDKRYVPKVKS